MKSVLKLVLWAFFAFSIVCCSTKEDDEIFQEIEATEQEEAKTMDGGEHDYCRKNCK